MNIIDVDQRVLEELRAMITLPRYKTVLSYNAHFTPIRNDRIFVQPESLALCGKIHGFDLDRINLAKPKTLDEVHFLHIYIESLEPYIHLSVEYDYQKHYYTCFPPEEFRKVLDLLKRLYPLPMPMTKSASRR
tara:strand:- start:8046 stop:8444 length:399 start_codon:yes stop_codon:yes gene_type:complete